MCEERVLHGLARVVAKEVGRLALVDVDAEAGDLAAEERVDGGARVDEAAAARVDDGDAGGHERERARVDQVVVLRRERHVQRDHVAAAEQLVERHVLHAEPRGPLRVRPRVVRVHAPAKAREDARRDAPDRARAHHAKRLVAQVVALQALQREVVRADALRRLRDVPRQAHQQRRRVLRHRVRRVPRHAHHRHPQRPRTHQVHVVEARTPQQQQPHPARRQRPQHRRTPVVVHKDAHRVHRPAHNRTRRLHRRPLLVEHKPQPPANLLLTARPRPLKERLVVRLHAVEVHCERAHLSFCQVEIDLSVKQEGGGRKRSSYGVGKKKGVHSHKTNTNERKKGRMREKKKRRSRLEKHSAALVMGLKSVFFSSLIFD